jgi:CPA1 family monovalent cation:H+ antiporter
MGTTALAVSRELAWLLLGAALVGMLARWIRLPYAVALVIGGLLLEESHVTAVPSLHPDVLLLILLPPLLFDAAFRMDERELRVVFPPILTLAIPGVIVTAVLVGVVVALVLRLPLAVGLLFGAIVSATDPVAVTAVFDRLGVHNRLATIAEAESLVNDGTAITLYTALLGLALSGTASPGSAALLFVTEVAGGVLVGAVAGVLFSHLTATIDDHLLEMMLSTALAYGSYLVAQSLHTSGALACVCAGLIHGSYGRRIGMSEHTRTLLDHLWEYLGFFANAFVFLLVGFSANVPRLLANALPVAVAIVAVLVSRVLVVELSGLTIPSERSLLTLAGRAVLAWGGLRGALTIALALAIPDTIPQRQLLVTMAFGVVLFTLLVQASTLGPLVQKLGLAGSATRTE